MFCVKSLHIEKFKQINRIELKDLPNTQWIFLTGENGYGKTLILQAIATALYPIDKNINEIVNSSQTGITSIVELNNGDVYGVYPGKSNRSEFKRNSNFIFLSCYGSSRLLTSNKESNAEKDLTYPDLDRLFKDQSIFKNIEYELIKWKLKSESKKINREEELILKNRLEWVKNIFIELLNLADIDIDSLNEKVTYIEKDVKGEGLIPVDRDKLGSGFKSLIGLVGDLIIKLINSKQPTENPLKLLGIVLIDEIELHLHPKLQREIPRVLSKFFPRIQFIVSSHSPMPLLGAPENSVFLKVDRFKEEGIILKRLPKLEKDIKYLLPNSLFSSEIFGFSEIESNNNPRIGAIRTEDDYNQIEELEKAKERLRKVDDSIFPKELFNTKK